MLRITLASVALLAVTAAAQNLPACAQSCVTNYNGCNQLDVKCICTSSGWIAGLACCVANSCDPDDQEATIKFADKICEGVGVTTLPQTAICTTGAAAATGSAAASTSPLNASASLSSASASEASASSSVQAASSSVQAEVASSASSARPTATGSGADANKAAGVGMGAIVAGLIAAL